jgi:hypothetical protein
VPRLSESVSALRVDPPLVGRHDVDGLVDELATRGVRTDRISLTRVANMIALFDRLRATMTFPDYMGSGWDSLDDAADDIAADTEFPLVHIIDDITDLLQRDPRLALDIALHLDLAAREWRSENIEWHVLFPVPNPPPPLSRPARRAPRTHIDLAALSALMVARGDPRLIEDVDVPELLRRAERQELLVGRVRLDREHPPIDPDVPDIVVADGLQQLIADHPGAALNTVLTLGVPYRTGLPVIYSGTGWRRTDQGAGAGFTDLTDVDIANDTGGS